MPPLGALTQAWTAAEAALPLGKAGFRLRGALMVYFTREPDPLG